MAGGDRLSRLDCGTIHQRYRHTDSHVAAKLLISQKSDWKHRSRSACGVKRQAFTYLCPLVWGSLSLWGANVGALITIDSYVVVLSGSKP